MIEYKKVPFITCDLCGKDEGEVSIQSWNMLSGLGYAPSNTDPLAQKFKKLYKKVDICDSCRARMDHNYLGLSPEEREQIVYANIAVHDNRKDLRVDPRHEYGVSHSAISDGRVRGWINLYSL